MNRFIRDQSHKILPGPNIVIKYLILKLSYLGLVPSGEKQRAQQETEERKSLLIIAG